MRAAWTICQLALLGPLSAAADPLDAALAKTLGARHDESLSRAARRHAAALLAGELERDVREATRAEGLADALVAPFAALGGDGGREALAFAEARRDFGTTHFGVARIEGPRAALVVLLSRRLLELPPLSPRASGEARLVGRLAAPGATSVFLTLPSGEVERVEGAIARGRSFAVSVPLDAGRGLYDVEVLLEGPRGPEIAALWRWAVGRPPASPGPIPLLPDLEALADAIARLRGGPLPRDARLDRAAAQHAEASCKLGVAAHVLPGGEGPRERAAREGWLGPVAENVALSASLGRAHTDLLGSPSHRLNLVGPAAALGLGLARGPSGVCLVELFGQR